MIDSKKLRYFSVLAKLGNFNAAAAALHISQPALSRSIQALENSLNLTLIDRSQRTIKLTAAGQHLLKHARSVLQDLENIALEADKLRLLKAGTLTIGSGPFPADHIGARACGEFLNRFPEVRLGLFVDKPEALVARLVDGEMDLLLAGQRSIAGFTELSFQPLPSFSGVVLARPGHPLAIRRQLTFDDLKRYPHASISQLSSLLVADVFGLSEQAASAQLQTFTCNSVQLMLTTIKHSNAIGIALSCNVEEELARDELCLLDVPVINNLTSNYGIVTYQPRLLSLTAEKYIEIVCEIAGRLPSGDLML